jgi:hypothetical protein
MKTSTFAVLSSYSPITAFTRLSSPNIRDIGVSRTVTFLA